jgi:hypothetical protein
VPASQPWVRIWLVVRAARDRMKRILPFVHWSVVVRKRVGQSQKSPSRTAKGTWLTESESRRSRAPSETTCSESDTVGQAETHGRTADHGSDALSGRRRPAGTV